jgi:hypothetical protein
LTQPHDAVKLVLGFPRVPRVWLPARRARVTDHPKELTFQPLTPLNWPDLEQLFGEKGACGGCWCMYWRLTRPQFHKQKGKGAKRALRRIGIVLHLRRSFLNLEL